MIADLAVEGLFQAFADSVGRVSGRPAQHSLDISEAPDGYSWSEHGRLGVAAVLDPREPCASR